MLPTSAAVAVLILTCTAPASAQQEPTGGSDPSSATPAASPGSATSAGSTTSPNPATSATSTAPAAAPRRAPGSAVRAGQDGLPEGVSREQMWPAPTAADWQRPVLVTWQRTWDDALQLSRETGKAILVCVNMDGEIASEHYAGIRYRQPEIAALYEPYVTVIASVYRHNERDHDEEGRRILCPRFGSVTCGEHIEIEPVLYEQFFEGKRIAPRHIMVELDRAETYDVYYAWDTASVFERIERGIAERDQPPPVERGDRTLAQLVASVDVADRIAVERRYAQGDRAERLRILDAAAALGPDAPIEVLRLAIFGLDLDLARLARAALAQSTQPGAVDLIVEALRVPMEPAEREALIAALARLGESSPRAATLAVVHRGLTRRSALVDESGWDAALGGASYADAAAPALHAERLQNQNEVLASDDPQAQLELAESFLVQAYDQWAADETFARLLFMDARNTALAAERAGASGWRVDAVVSIASYYLDERELAHGRAEAAVGAGIPDDATGWNAMAVLAIFAQARQEAIQEAVVAKQQWPPQLLTDVRAAYAIIARHPHGTAAHVLAHYDFLGWLGAGGEAGAVLDEGLARFPGSPDLHDRLRRRVLWERGVDGLLAEYERRLAVDGAAPVLHWYAAYAAQRAAEYHRRKGEDDAALDLYARAIELYERDAAARPDARHEADAQVAMVLAGRARIALQRGDDERALSELVASFERAPSAAADLDGLNLSAVDTARTLMSRLAGQGRDDQLARLRDALAGLDPELLRLPAYERGIPDDGAGRADLRPARRDGGPLRVDGSGSR